MRMDRKLIPKNIEDCDDDWQDVKNRRRFELILLLQAHRFEIHYRGTNQTGGPHKEYTRKFKIYHPMFTRGGDDLL